MPHGKNGADFCNWKIYRERHDIFRECHYNSTIMLQNKADGFEAILRTSESIATELPGVVFIGGVAIYLHTVNNPRHAQKVESSHDSDFMISLSDFSALRDQVEVIYNSRLGKHQAIIGNVEFDVYVERRNNLIVPYDEAFAYSSAYGPLRVACLEHLFVLKLEAYSDRRGSSKGDKDERDLVRIASISGHVHSPELMLPYLDSKHLEVLEKLSRGSVFSEMCRGNSHDAKKLRQSFSRFVAEVVSLANR